MQVMLLQIGEQASESDGVKTSVGNQHGGVATENTVEDTKEIGNVTSSAVSWISSYQGSVMLK